MGHDFRYSDIIILALIAGFLILRLRAALGKRPDNDQGDIKDPGDAASHDPFGVTGTVINFPAQSRSTSRDARPMTSTDEANPLSPLLRADPTFDSQHFLTGARTAFEMILAAFAKGDLLALRPLLGDAIYANFAAAVEERNRQQHTMEAVIERFSSISVLSTAVNDTLAFITVRFVSDQVVVVRDKDGHILEGQPGVSHTITDDWTFARPVRSHDPNWQLIATQEAH